jgi:hypothetical protein
VVQVVSNEYPPFPVDWNTTVDILLKDPCARESTEKIFARHLDQSKCEPCLEALGSGDKWNEWAYLEAPLCHLYITKSCPMKKLKNDRCV